EKYPDKSFVLIMGQDNLNTLHKWKNYGVILENHEIFVYPRIVGDSKTAKLQDHPKIKQVNAHDIEISSSYIRKAIRDGKNTQPLLSENVFRYIDEMNFYR